MAVVSRGRIVRGAGDAAPATQKGADTVEIGPRSPAPARSPVNRGRIVVSGVLDAHDEARAIVDVAKRAAAQIEIDVRAEAERSHQAFRAELRAEADARIAAALLAVRAEDEQRADRDLARLAETAVVLAERLLGEALALEPSRIHAMAQAALTEARGARRVVFEANPLDAAALQAQLHALGLPSDGVSVEARDDLARGDLVLRTDLGTLDARLKPQLQRLADALSRAATAARAARAR